MVCRLTLYELFLWAPTPCQAIQWNPELPFAQIPVEPKTEEEIQKSNDSGGQWQTKHVVAFLCHKNVTFMREIFQNDSIWLTPLPSGTTPIQGHADGGPHANLREEVRHWDFWKQVPDVTDFGKSIPGDAFIRNGGNYMQLLKRLNNLHQGEVVEINCTGEWVFIDGMPPSDMGWWQAQFAETRGDAELLRDVGAMGSRSFQTRQRRHTSWGGSAHGMPDETKERLKEISGLTHAKFKKGSWEGEGYVARKARVLTLNQVLMLDPVHTTMQEAYVWYCQQQKMCKVRAHQAKAGKAWGSKTQWWGNGGQWVPN